MTDEAKALVERLRLSPGLMTRDTVARVIDVAVCEASADLIETQAREIERLRVALQGISEFGGRHTGHGYSCHLLARAALGESQ